MKGPESFLFRAVARFSFFVINVMAVHLLLRGHDLPGGGFIGGLATAISLILLSLGIGLEELHRVIRADPVRVAAAGVTIALLTALGPLFFGAGFLEHFNRDVPVPVLGDIHIGTALLFDIGVYLAVVGVTVKIVFILAKSTQGLRALVEEDQARYSSTRETPIELEPAEEGEPPPPPEERPHAG